MALVIIINDNEVNLDTSGLSALSDLLEKITEGVIGPTELIKGVWLDNEFIENHSFSSGGQRSIKDIKTISITTIKDPIATATALIERMTEYLDRFAKGLNSVSDRFRTGAVEEANSMMIQVVEGLQSLNELVETLKELSQTKLDDIRLDDENFSSLEERLTAIMKALHDGQEAKDWVTVADMLEYELAPAIGEWVEFLPLLSDKLKEETD